MTLTSFISLIKSPFAIEHVECAPFVKKWSITESKELF